MANIQSAKKRIRQTASRTVRNVARRSRIRTFIRRVEDAIVIGDKIKATDALKAAQPEIMKGVTKGVLKKNTASRKVSRLTHRIAKMAQTAI